MAVMLLFFLSRSIFISIGIILLYLLLCCRIASQRRRQYQKKRGSICVGFFHPTTRDGGGGERVLWCAVNAVVDAINTLTSDPKTDKKMFIYTGDVDDDVDCKLSERSSKVFGLSLRECICMTNGNVKAKRKEGGGWYTLAFERVYLRRLSEASLYPFMTIMFQLVGGAILGVESLAFCRLPGIIIDTSGNPFMYPIAKLFGVKVVSYTHYPVISSGMVDRISSQVSTYNNSAFIAKSKVVGAMKVSYYRLLVLAYGYAMRCADLVIANSSWTSTNVELICGTKPTIIYPPCDTALLEKLPLRRKKTLKGAATEKSKEREYVVFLSVAQFRPEKDHMLQIKAFIRARDYVEQKYGNHPLQFAQLKVVGSCRNAEDEKRLQALKDEVAKQNVEKFITFHESVPFPQLVRMFGEADVGLHTMEDEHFGISIVEYMAAGAIPIAHNSGGPKEDIVGAANVYFADESSRSNGKAGYLAETIADYTSAIVAVASLSIEQRLEMAGNARQYVRDRFSVKAFNESFQTAILRKIL